MEIRTKYDLMQAIQDVIKNNGNHEITGNTLQNVLLLMVDFLATNGQGATIPICDGNGHAIGDSKLTFDGSQLEIYGEVNVKQQGIVSEKGITSVEGDISALNGDLIIGNKGSAHLIHLYDMNNPTMPYTVSVVNGLLVCNPE